MLECTEATHLAVLTDRMRFRRYGLDVLLDAINAAPDDIISYGYDTLEDWDPSHVHVELAGRTRRLYRVQCRQMLDAFVEARHRWAWQTPKLLSSAVPQRVFADLKRTRADGRLFASFAPDYYFAFKVLATEPRIALCDDGVIVEFALAVSNGHTFQSGLLNDAARDMLRWQGDQPRYNSPYPDVITTMNTIVHEYNVVRDEVGHGSMPPWPAPSVRMLLEGEARRMFEPAKRGELFAELGVEQDRGDSAARRLVGEDPGVSRQLRTVVRHPVESARVASYRLGFDRFVAALGRAWGDGASTVFRRWPRLLGWASRRWRVTFPSLDVALDAVEDVEPATTGRDPAGRRGHGPNRARRRLTQWAANRVVAATISPSVVR